MEELDAHLISNFTGPIYEFEFLDIAKKYPIKMVIVRNIIECFNSRLNHSYCVDFSFWA